MRTVSKPGDSSVRTAQGACVQCAAQARTVFHLLATLVNVVEPDDMSTWRMRFSNVFSASSSTRRNACHDAHTPSFED